MSPQAIYDSPLHIPITAWIGAATAVLLARRSRGFAILFAIVCALDAWLTGPWSPLDASGRAYTLASVVFVVAGDLRFFLLCAWSFAKERFTLRGVIASLGLALVIPVVTALTGLSGRPLFLAYEALFAASCALAYAVVRRRAPTYVLALTRFEIAQYALWALADVVILAGVSAGHLLRIVPNVMYYAVFLPFAVSRREAR